VACQVPIFSISSSKIPLHERGNAALHSHNDSPMLWRRARPAAILTDKQLNYLRVFARMVQEN
jgi:hypothetical protein